MFRAQLFFFVVLLSLLPVVGSFDYAKKLTSELKIRLGRCSESKGRMVNLHIMVIHFIPQVKSLFKNARSQKALVWKDSE